MPLGRGGPEVLVSDERERTWIRQTRESKGREISNGPALLRTWEVLDSGGRQLQHPRIAALALRRLQWHQ